MADGVRPYGIDIFITALRGCRSRSLPVEQGRGEHLHFPAESFDGVICKVVLPHVNERETIEEIGPVLRAGGMAYILWHGAGYYLRYLLQSPRLAFRVYGARDLLNTWLWATAGRLLPGLPVFLYHRAKKLGSSRAVLVRKRSLVNAPRE